MTNNTLKKEGFLSKILKSSLLINIWCWVDNKAFEQYTKQFSKEFNWSRLIPFITVHLVCLFAFVVGWSPFAIMFAAAFYVVRMFAITGVYHRYFSHKSYKMNRFWQFCFAILGNMAVQKGPLWWAAHHRHHHRFSDTEHDLHSPRHSGFWWSHIGWFACSAHFKTDLKAIPDFAKFPELRFLNRFDALVPFLTAVAIFFLGVALEAFAPTLGTNGWQMLIWGFFISTVVLFHGTVSINSLTHMWGKKRFNTTDTSKNSLILALITMGEGWHNNHHRYAASTRQGFYWWEIDVTFYILKILSFVGIVHSLKPVPLAIYDEALETKRLNRKTEKLMKNLQEKQNNQVSETNNFSYNNSKEKDTVYKD